MEANSGPAVGEAVLTAETLARARALAEEILEKTGLRECLHIDDAPEIEAYLEQTVIAIEQPLQQQIATLDEQLSAAHLRRIAVEGALRRAEQERDDARRKLQEK